MTHSRPWMIQMVALVILFYHELLSPSTVIAASTYNFVANQRPRFQIPQGNLSYYRSPQWEILYYLKFGVFPFYSSSSSSYLNRTQYLNKMRLIKSLLDQKEGTVGTGGESEAMENDSAPVTDFPHEHHPLADIEFHIPTFPTGSSVEEEKTYPSFYYPLAQIKKNSQKQAKTKRDDLLTNYESLDGEKLRRKDSGAINFDYFLVDNDPTWLRNRIPKETRMSPGSRMFVTGDDGGSAMHGGGSGSLAAEMTIERKVGRKFQTQGWK